MYRFSCQEFAVMIQGLLALSGGDGKTADKAACLFFSGLGFSIFVFQREFEVFFWSALCPGISMLFL